MNTFAEKLKELREEKGLSQLALSKELGFSQAAITRWENNIQTPNIDVAIAVATYFNVSTDYLFGLEK
ncbi:MAG: helix-turn-helix transcriptional regulator [Clostridia bacterium]|nr:helix-turn-helix transcriptional regulator [Clostridia bacterium]